MKKQLLSFLAASLLLGTSISARAQLANDDCAGALPLAVASSCTPLTATNVGATTNVALPAQPCGGTTANNDVWYSLVVPASGAVTVNTGGVTGSTFTDTVLEIYAGSCGSLTALGCNDDYTSASAFSSLTVGGQPAGTTLFVRIYGFGSRTGAFTICAREAQLLANDECAGALPLPVGNNCARLAVTNAGASSSRNVPAPLVPCFQPGTPIANDVWFSLVVPPSGEVAVGTFAIAGSDLDDTGLVLYSGTCGNLTQVACNDDYTSTNLFSIATATGLTPGSTVYARVWSVDYTLTGAFNICAINPTPLATRSRLNKVPMSVYPNPVRETLTVKLPALSGERSAQVALLNSLGQIVKLRLVALRGTEVETMLSVSELPAGVYTLRLQTESSMGTHKIVVE